MLLIILRTVLVYLLQAKRAYLSILTILSVESCAESSCLTEKKQGYQHDKYKSKTSVKPALQMQMQHCFSSFDRNSPKLQAPKEDCSAMVRALILVLLPVVFLALLRLFLHAARLILLWTRSAVATIMMSTSCHKRSVLAGARTHSCAHPSPFSGTVLSSNGYSCTQSILSCCGHVLRSSHIYELVGTCIHVCAHTSAFAGNLSNSSGCSCTQSIFSCCGKTLHSGHTRALHVLSQQIPAATVRPAMHQAKARTDPRRSSASSGGEAGEYLPAFARACPQTCVPLPLLLG